FKELIAPGHLASAFLCCVPSIKEGRNLSFFSAPDIASVAVSLGWDCKGRNLFRNRKIFFKIFFEALFRWRPFRDFPLPLAVFLSLCQWPCGRPSLAEWCKDRDKIPSLPRGQAKYFSPGGITRCSIAR
ncbi:hypothetical protein SAMN05192578_1051, partial [Sphingobacterium mizutaii]